MMRASSRAVPWAILLAVVFAAVVLYFAGMLQVIGQISEERDDLERLSRVWLAIELSVAELPGPDGGVAVSSVGDFQSQLGRILDLQWFGVLHRAYPQLRVRSDALRAAVSGLPREPWNLPGRWADFRGRAKTVELDLASLLEWIGVYRQEQMRAFRVLLVFLAASAVLGSLGLLGFGSLLRIQEARFLTAMGNLHDAVILTDGREQIIYANPAARSLLSANREGPNDRLLPQALQRRFTATGAPGVGGTTGRERAAHEEIETSLVDSEGRRRAVTVNVEDIREASGKRLGSVYFVRDLTEWRKLVASISSAFVHLQIEDADDAVTRALDEAAALCGAKERALLLFEDPVVDGPGLRGRVHEVPVGLPPRIIQWVREAAAGGETAVLSRKTATGKEAELVSGGSIAWVTAVPLRFAGTVVGAIALAGTSGVGEIEERQYAVIRVLGVLIVELLTKRWAMGEMDRLGAEYHDLIESANVPIWGVDLDGKVNEWNAVVASLTGHARTSVIGQPALSLFDPDRTPAVFERLMSGVLSRERIGDKELQMVCASGAPCTLLVSGSPRLDSAGRVIGSIFIGQDITGRISAERRIREQARALIGVQEIERLRISRDLHDSVAQDLSAARIACDTLFDEPVPGESELRERVARIAAPVSAALESIRTIAYELRPTEDGPDGLAASLGRMCASFGRARSLEVRFQASGTEHLSLSADSSTNICRVAQEALSNAARHARAGRIDVTLVYSHPDLILRIVDDGVGFDVEQSFMDAADRRRMGLLGLRERAAILGATLSIVSKLNKGTQIRLTIPVPGTEVP
jgi:PAS domain S-box-containing protein